MALGWVSKAATRDQTYDLLNARVPPEIKYVHMHAPVHTCAHVPMLDARVPEQIKSVLQYGRQYVSQ